MSNDHDSIGAVLLKILVLVAAWVASLKAVDVQVMVAIFSGLAVGAYAVLNLIALWKREFKGK